MEHTKTHLKQLESAAESDVSTPATVVPGHGYPANRLESSPEPTGWRASGEGIGALGSTEELIEVSRETSR
jgi:hypothetical protein